MTGLFVRVTVTRGTSATSDEVLAGHATIESPFRFDEAVALAAARMHLDATRLALVELSAVGSREHTR